jgi:hypothetical protein
MSIGWQKKVTLKGGVYIELLSSNRVGILYAVISGRRCTMKAIKSIALALHLAWIALLWKLLLIVPPSKFLVIITLFLIFSVGIEVAKLAFKFAMSGH